MMASDSLGSSGFYVGRRRAGAIVDNHGYITLCQSTGLRQVRQWSGAQPQA